MNIQIRKVTINDAKQIVDYCNQVAGESDNMSCGVGEFGITYEQELDFLKSIEDSINNFMMVAIANNQIIGLTNISGSSRPRTMHNVDLGISVKQKYWSLGVGSKLLDSMIEECQKTGLIRNIHLLVVADNTKGIGLYKKYGFKQVGSYANYHFVNEQYKDLLIMEKIL